MYKFAVQRSLIKRVSFKMPIKGVIPGARMFSLQESLPHLPVPALDQTLQKYLRTVKVLVPEQQFQKTSQIVSGFLQKDGAELQTRLLNFARDKENWLSDWWTEVAYLGNRLPVTINVNPGTVMPPADFMGDDKQAQLGAHIIAAILDYKRHIDDQSLAVEYLGKRPLCMTQFYKILCGSRIPRATKDEWRCYPPNEPDPPHHVVVIHENRFYRVEVYDKLRQPLTLSQLYHQLQDILNRHPTEAPPVGILTSMQRDDWAEAYKHLCADNQNSSNCEAINRSIVVICLDKALPLDGSPEERMAKSLQQCIHGCGSRSNTGNRWFDKTLQYIVGTENQSGLCYEHTSAEGPPIVSLTDHIVNFVQTHGPFTTGDTANAPPPVELVFNVDSTTAASIDKASQRIDQALANLKLCALTFDSYGKNLIKQNKLSPDAYIQQAIQLTYQRMHGEPGNTYESGSTRMFVEGRTDTVRSCTPESQRFVTAVDRQDINEEVKVNLLREAILEHRKCTDEVISGQGIDRHLLGLKLIALKNSLPLPDFFNDPSFTNFTSFKLSTSQVPSKSDQTVMAYGPAVTDGYGVCYNPADNKMYFTVSGFKESKLTDVSKFAQTLSSSLNDMADIVNVTQRSKL